MHIVMWKYEVMEGKSRQDLIDAVHSDAPDYQDARGLVRLYYGIAPDFRSVTQVFVWRSKADADRYFDPEWDGTTSRRWESARMTRTDLELAAIVDAEAKRVVTDG
jgi:hypothetical protein